MSKRKKNAPSLEESGQWLRTGQAVGGFECAHCSATFQTQEQLRQHEVDCLSDGDDLDTWQL